MNKKDYKKFGKQGSDKRWASRHALLVELSKHVDKPLQTFLLKWPTSHLERLYKAYTSELKSK